MVSPLFHKRSINVSCRFPDPHLAKRAPAQSILPQISSYPYDDALREMNEAGVDAALIHPPAPRWDPQANELALTAVRQHPSRFGILGHFPLDQPESRGLVDGWKHALPMDRLAIPRNDGVAVDEVHYAAQSETTEADFMSNFQRLSVFASAVTSD
jgi:hypothetical protein